MAETIIGIDPGVNGGVAVLDSKTNELIDVLRTPTFKVGKKKKINITKMSDFVSAYALSSKIVAIEKVHAMPKQGVSSTFSFGFNTGVAHGVVKTFNLEVLEVHPAVWKGYFNLNKDKKAAIDKAQKLFPLWTEYLKHDGNAEAALIARFTLEHL